MGKAARAQASTAITLDPADFYRLIAKLRHLEVVRLEARDKAAKLAVEMVQKDVAGVEAEFNRLVETLAKQYGFDATREYRFDEATCALTPVAAGPAR